MKRFSIKHTLLITLLLSSSGFAAGMTCKASIHRYPMNTNRAVPTETAIELISRHVDAEHEEPRTEIGLSLKNDLSARYRIEARLDDGSDEVIFIFNDSLSGASLDAQGSLAGEGKSARASLNQVEENKEWKREIKMVCHPASK